MRFAPVTAAAAVLLLCSAPLAARDGVDSLPVGPCINIGNHLESPAENGWGGARIGDADFRNIAAAGFQTVRIPVRWDSHAAGTAPHTIDSAWLKRVEAVVDGALDAGLNVILDSHNFEGLHEHPDDNRDELAALWSQIAARFADRPTDRLWFEIENEPHHQLANANLPHIFAPALAEIRKSNPDRPVIVGGEFWSGIDSLATLNLPDDPHMIPTFHYYEPFAFTHQGADWPEEKQPLGRVYGGPEDQQRLKDDIAKVRAYIARTGKTPFIGESGAYDVISLDQRVAYTRAVHDAFAPLGVGLCTWAYTNTFPFYDHDKKRWLPGMLGAMGLAEPGRK